MTPFQQSKALNNLLMLHLRGCKPKPKPMAPASENPERIIRRICAMMATPFDEVTGKTHAQHVVYVRFIIAQHLRDEVGLNWSQIGEALNRNHATAIYYYKQYSALKSTKDKIFMDMVEKVKMI